MTGRKPILASFLAIVLGVLVIATAVGGMWWSWTRILAAGDLITVPVVIDVDVAPGREQAIWRELEGTHITRNTPLLPPPEDLVIVITDRRSGEALPTEELNWRVRQSVMPGFVRNRRSLLAFDPPEHGEVTVSVAGSFDHPQVFRVAPSIRNWSATVMPAMRIGLGAGTASLLAGVVVLIAMAVRQESRPAIGAESDL